MPRLILYIETSVWSHFFADDSPQLRDETRTFFANCERKQSEVALHISQAVIDELAAASQQKATELAKLVVRFHPDVLEETEEVAELAQAYMAQGAIPPSKEADALHAAIATVYEMDALVSWNYKHLVSLARRHKINGVNAINGYNKTLDIITPPEVLEDVDKQGST